MIKKNIFLLNTLKDYETRTEYIIVISKFSEMLKSTMSQEKQENENNKTEQKLKSKCDSTQDFPTYHELRYCPSISFPYGYEQSLEVAHLGKANKQVLKPGIVMHS